MSLTLTACYQCQSWNSERNSRCATCDLHHKYDRHITRGEDSFHNQAEVDEFGRKKSSLKPNGAQDGPRWPPPFDRRSSTYVFDARSGMFYHASSQFFFDPKTKLYFGNKEQTYYTYCKDSHPPFTEYKSDNSSNLENNLEPKVETKQIISISLKTKVLSSNNATKEVKRKGETQITLSTPSFSKHHESNLNRWSERGRELAGKIPIVRTNTGQPVCLLCKRKFLDLKALETHEDLSTFHKTNEKKYGKRVRKIVEASEAEYARDRAMERRQLHGDESDLLPINRFRVSSDASISVAQPQSLDDANVGNKLLKKLGWQEGTNLGRTGVEELSGVNLRKEWERIEKITGNNINP
jgi:OCRE domain